MDVGAFCEVVLCEAVGWAVGDVDGEVAGAGEREYAG